jgi:aminoglycoside phosphotransferase (APT) family kinase protein
VSALLDEAAAPREALEAERLEAFLEKEVPGWVGPLEVLQFRKGHSNLTYLLRGGDGRELVLRRPPFGARIATAHDMAREHRILEALRPHFPCAPRVVGCCDDESIIGAPFYVMERVRGVILRGMSVPAELGLEPPRMRALSAALVDRLADLHAVDLDRTGLASLGKPEGYVARQVQGWTERYQRARTDDVPELERAAEWLAAHRPPESGAALIHNDYKYDNLVLDPADPTRIVAVLDWEMATVGDPLLDLGTSLAYWVDPDDPEEMRALPLGPTAAPGNLSRTELLARYAERTGRDPGDGLFPYVYGLFKVAVIAQQIYRRFVDGHTKDPRFAALILGVRILGAQAERALDRGRIDALR